MYAPTLIKKLVSVMAFLIQGLRRFANSHCLCVPRDETQRPMLTTPFSLQNQEQQSQMPCICPPRDELQNVLVKLQSQFSVVGCISNAQDQEEVFQNIQKKLCIMIGLKEISPVQVIGDIVDYAHRNRYTRELQMSWQALHFARYLAYKFTVTDVPLVQCVFEELFWITGCIEEKAFIPDDLVVNSFWFRFIEGLRLFREMHLRNVEYYLAIVANLHIDLTDYSDIRHWTVYGDKRSYPYIDLHVWFRNISVDDVNDLDIRQVRLQTRLGWSSLLFLAYTYQMDDLGLLLLRYNATATGPVLQLVFKQIARELMLEANPLFKKFSHTENEYTPKRCLRHCLRTVTTLNIETGDYEAIEQCLSKGYHATNYVVAPEALHLIPKSCYTEPCSLKQYCRVLIREMLFKSGHLPSDIRKLEIPDCLKDYLDLLTD